MVGSPGSLKPAQNRSTTGAASPLPPTRKIMIYTPRQTINRRIAGKRLNSRPAGENADRGDLSNGADLGLNSAPTVHKTPPFAPSAEGHASGERLVFSVDFAIFAAHARGDINKSAELLIIAAARSDRWRRSMTYLGAKGR